PRIQRLHFTKVEAPNKLPEDLHLPPKGRIAAARLFRRINEIARLVPGNERVVEVIEQAAAGQDETPGLAAIGQIVRATKTGLVVANDLVEAVVQRDRVGRGGGVEIEDRNCRIRILDLRLPIRDVPRDEMELAPSPSGCEELRAAA